MSKKYNLLTTLIGIPFLTACAALTQVPTQVDLPVLTKMPSIPPVPSTATLAITPAPTASALPTAIPMYFTEEFNSDLSAWASFQTGGANPPVVNLENDALRIDFSSPDTWYYAVHTAHEYSYVSISANVAGTSGSAGLICDYSEASGWFEFNIASDRTYNILFGQWLADGIAQYTPIANDTVDSLESGSLNYEIGLTCGENNLLVYINGKLFRKLDVTRFGLTTGRIGISASSYNEIPVTVFFNWIKVSGK